MALSFATPLVFVLVPVALALLVLLRLLRARRRVVIAGSLLIWHRLSILPVSVKPKRIIFDRSLLLQALALTALIAALARPALLPSNSNARTILLLLDNGPLSRARNTDGKPAFAAVLEESKQLLQRLNKRDRVFIARSSPSPALLQNEALDPSAAATAVAAVVPALSGPDSAAIWLFASGRARALARDSSVQVAVVSLSGDPNPASASNSNALWICAADEKQRFQNVGIVEAGSLQLDSKNGRHALVRAANFSGEKRSGTVVLETVDGQPKVIEERPLTIEAGQQAAAGFAIPDEIKAPLRLSWRGSATAPDALPEDDSVVLAPRAVRPPRIRFNAPQPALEKVFKLALDADVVAAGNSREGGIDLDVYAGSVPDRIPEDARAALFVAPERGYHSYYDIGNQVFVSPSIERGEDDPLNAEIPQGYIPKALEILRTGDFKILLRETKTGRAIAARFRDEKSRPCYLLAFVPGEGLSPDARLPKPLFALLVRIALEASNAGPPYALEKAADIEAAAGRPLPLDWRPGFDAARRNGGGVLSEKSSDHRERGAKATSEAALGSFLASKAPSTSASIDLSVWLILLGLLLAAIEFYMPRE